MRSIRRSELTSHLRGDRGQVTAETAMVTPSLVLLTALLLWGLFAFSIHIQCLDAARAGARAAARAEPWPRVTEAAQAVAPAGARVETRRKGEHVHVRVSSRRLGAGALSVELSAEMVAQAEDQPLGGLLDRPAGQSWPTAVPQAEASSSPQPEDSPSGGASAETPGSGAGVATGGP